jgi:hypothetical protein
MPARYVVAWLTATHRDLHRFPTGLDQREFIMSARLTTAIRMGEAANGILKKIRRFPAPEFSELEDLSGSEHVGVEPMLLALAMELALKAWYVFDFDDPHAAKSHDLLKLFESLKPESRDKLDAQFKALVAPTTPAASLSTTAFVTYLVKTKMPLWTGAISHEAKLQRAPKTVTAR